MDIEYGQTIIVLVKYNNIYNWYISDKYYWILDLGKLYETPIELREASAARFGIDVITDKNVEYFIKEISKFKVDTDSLTLLLLEYNCLVIDETSGLQPALLVDFDKKVLTSYFSELLSFEIYIPDAWQGNYAMFLDKIPAAEKYWIYEGHDYFDAHKTIKHFWGEQLLTYSSNLLEIATFSQSIKLFLQKVGLPHRKGTLTEELVKHLFINFSANPTLNERFSISDVNYFTFATFSPSSDDLFYIGLQENTGKIVLVNKKNTVIYPVNSDIVAFLLFLQIYLASLVLVPAMRVSDSSKVKYTVQNIGKQFYQIDDLALWDEEGFWYVRLKNLGFNFEELGENFNSSLHLGKE